jgi:hypothetical protein
MGVQEVRWERGGTEPAGSYTPFYGNMTHGLGSGYFVRTWSDNKVRELATVCVPWQQWTETSVRFGDAGISAFHSCVDSCESVLPPHIEAVVVCADDDYACFHFS